MSDLAPPLIAGLAPRRSLVGAALLLALPLAALLGALPLPPAVAPAGLGLFLLTAAIAQARIATHLGMDRLGAANLVTLVRAAGASALAAVALAPQAVTPALAWGLCVGAGGLVALDGLDGWLARRQDLATTFGARFDMEVDAMTILALAGLAFGLGKAGPWLLTIGLMRYGFVVAGRVWPALARPLPPSTRRKAICVQQLATLALLLAPPVVPPLSNLLAAAALLALGISFAIDIAWALDARSALGLARSLLIYRARPWQVARLVRLYRDLLRPGDRAFDIGAHVGNRTLAMRAAGAQVLALEPQHRFHAFLARTLPRDVILLPLAAGAAAGKAELAVSRLHPTVSSLAPGFARRMGRARGFTHVRWDAREPVTVTTLDALIAAHGLPRFIKIDTEGHEADVLRGLSQPVPWVAFEYLPDMPEVAQDCLARLAELGPYRFNLIEGEAAEFAMSRWTDADGMAAALAGQRRSGDIYACLGDG